MPARVLRVTDNAHDEVRRRIATIQAEQGITPDFPAAVEAEAAASHPALPANDRTDLAFVTIDPPTSMDLDQAMHLERDGDGFVVHYAIADLGSCVTPGGALDAETHRRGETLYGADATVPLHPRVLSEGSASLLPDQDRSAMLWTLRLDAAGELTDTTLERAHVRSRAKLDYAGVQRDLDAGTAGDMLEILRDVGRLRLAREADRGGVSLPMPEQEIDIEGDQWTLGFRMPLDVEGWNAQISLLTGIAAAQMMLAAKVGIVRTLPAPPPGAVDRLRRRAKALDVAWPQDLEYPAFVRSLDPTKPNHAAMTVACTSLLRGAAYAGFDGVLPEVTEHAALATPYAHVTAPLRRLVDRYGLETCAALSAGTPVPDWLRTALPDLPDVMREADHRAHAYENAVVDLVECLVLQHSVGESFTGVVLEADGRDPRSGEVQVADPAVAASVTSERPLPVGEAVTVTLATVDLDKRKVAFRL